MVTLEQFCYRPTHATRPPLCIDFACHEPGIVAIFGTNGSGKSTLAQLLAGWYPDFLPGDITGKGTLLGYPIGQQTLVEQSPLSSSFNNHRICNSQAALSALKKRWPLDQKTFVLMKRRSCSELITHYR